MKKTEIVTFHSAYNYGAVLQAYALWRTIESLGAECDILNYRPEEFENLYQFRTKTPLSASTAKFLIKFLVKKLMVCKILTKRNRAFKSFIEKNIRLSEKYAGKDAGEKILSDCDCYITGSDQVWNYIWLDNDPIYFLDFPDALRKKRYSYAASFGMTELPPELKTEYERRLRGYDAYSVRERSGADIIRDLTGREAVVCCDPTLLLTGEEWGAMAGAAMDEPYILIYYIRQSESLFDRAKQLGEEKGLKVVSLPCNMDWKALLGRKEKRYGFQSAASSGPYEFLTLFKNASYVLTDSFHGTVFGIIFKKKFLTRLTCGDGTRNTRAVELFRELGIKNRDLETDFEKVDDRLDWDHIGRRIEEMRVRSLEYLRGIVKED